MSAPLQHRGRSRALWDYLQTSFWFVPAALALAAVLLVLASLWLDAQLAARPSDAAPWLVYVSTANDARDLLSTLLSSMIQMTTLVFSITMVVLTLAANQFGPRLVRNFMASPQTQAVLGTFVMTIVYCLLVLASIGRRGGAGLLPFSTVTLAIALTVVSVALLVFFLHTLARSIMSETVIERVGRELDGVIDDLAPLAPDDPVDPADALPRDFDREAVFVGPDKAGYVQAIEFDRLEAVARRADVLVGLYFRAGDYVVEGGQGIGIHPRDRVGDDLKKAISECILIGVHRTPVQDLEFSIRHLVEIAVRALSPGVNDPYTAVAVLNQLSASLSRIMNRALPPGLFADEDGKIRIVCPRSTYASLLKAGFSQIRQNGADKPLVVIHMLEALARIAERARLPVQLDAVREQLTSVRAAAEHTITDQTDREQIERRSTAAEDALKAAWTGGMNAPAGKTAS
ncbi:DUF2254 domain-containing protein [Chelatococcus sp. GCM10030263]|uniref:DUF2254 domain-containing protein n=1 Tax=Chelatococcus sp. GCM10030263 TaxID=3273387 RepID=UPI00361D1482